MTLKKEKIGSSCQNFYDLFAIQTVSLGLPVIVVGKQLQKLYGVGPAVCSIFIGNLLLWLIGLAIVSMVYHAKTNAVENIKGYLGGIGGLLFSIILILSFLDWYVVQINSVVIGISSLIQPIYSLHPDLIVRIGAVIGILGALFAIGGIRFLKWLTAIGFPLVVFYSFYAIIFFEKSLIGNWTWGISVPGIIATILILLPGVINLPTFFRHSRSKADSFLALTFMVIFYTFFECSSMWMGFSADSEYIQLGNTSVNLVSFVIPTIGFLVFTALCSNLLNIYLASACYETFIPRFSGTKGHAIMGLLGTAAYTFLQISAPMQFLGNLFSCYIGNIGAVLFIGVLSRIIIRHRPRKFEKMINFSAWVVGSFVATILTVLNPEEVVSPLLISMGCVALFFLLVFFVEETVWSIMQLS